MRILVCGGRDYTDYPLMLETMSEVMSYYTLEPEDVVIIHGAAPGADSLIDKWAKDHGAGLEIYPAEWRKYGHQAGLIRNQRMLSEGKPNLVIAFPGGRGTRDMINRSRKAGKAVKCVGFKSVKKDLDPRCRKCGEPVLDHGDICFHCEYMDEPQMGWDDHKD